MVGVIQRFACLWATFLCSILLSAQRLPSLSSAEFIRHSFVRNHYNLRIPIARINLQGTHLFEPHFNDLVLEQKGENPLAVVQQGQHLVVNSNEGGGSVVMRCSSFHPFLCYEVGIDRVEGEQGMAFYNGNQQIVVYKREGKVGIRTAQETKEVNDEHDCPITLRTQWMGARMHVFVCTEQSDSLLLSYKPSIQGRSADGLWDERAIDDWSFGAYACLEKGETASFNRVEASLACGTGQADPSVVQYPDGTPYIREGKLYVMLTTRGFGQIPGSYQGAYRLDLTTFQWELTGVLHFTRDGDHLLHPYHATKVVRDEQNDRWLVMSVSHGEDHCLVCGTTKADILHGMHVMDVKALHEPFEGTHTNEDPDFIYDARRKRWLLAYVSVIGDKGYQTILAEAKQWDGQYREVAHSEVGNETGTRIITSPNKHGNMPLYILSGGDTYNVLSYPRLERMGGLKARYPDGGFRGWASVTPIPWNDGQRWLWITFDRGRPYGRYSYGTLYIYLSRLGESGEVE